MNAVSFSLLMTGVLLNAGAQLLLKAGIFPAPTSGNAFSGGNNAPTEDDNLFRQPLHMCQCPRGKNTGHSDAGYRRDLRPGAGGDDHGIRKYSLLIKPDGFPIQPSSLSVVDINAGPAGFAVKDTGDL